MKKLKPNYFIIPLVTLMVAALGGYFTSQGMDGWYESLTRPQWTPPGSFISLMWTFLYILVTAVALKFWNSYKDSQNFKIIVGLFVVNAVLNATWSYVFFTVNLLGTAFLHINLLNLTILGLIYFLWKDSHFLSLALVPYFLWVTVATALNYSIWMLN